MGGCKPIIRYNSNSTLGEVELTWRDGVGLGVEMELGVELELDNIIHGTTIFYCKEFNLLSQHEHREIMWQN